MRITGSSWDPQQGQALETLNVGPRDTGGWTLLSIWLFRKPTSVLQARHSPLPRKSSLLSASLAFHTGPLIGGFLGGPKLFCRIFIGNLWVGTPRYGRLQPAWVRFTVLAEGNLLAFIAM